jgi:hypothetical protein
MAQVTFYGSDDGTEAASTTYLGVEFPRGEAVEISDPDLLAKLTGNPAFVIDLAAPKPMPPARAPAKGRRGK